MEQIMTLRFLLDTDCTRRRSLTVVFVDHCKAFDSVDRRAIPVVLRHYGVPDTAIEVVTQWYHVFSKAVSTRFGFTITLDTTNDVLQWDALSPHISILIVDYIFRKKSIVDEYEFSLKPANGRRHPAIAISALEYAFDVAITSDSAGGTERSIHRF